MKVLYCNELHYKGTSLYHFLDHVDISELVCEFLFFYTKSLCI